MKVQMWDVAKEVQGHLQSYCLHKKKEKWQEKN